MCDYFDVYFLAMDASIGGPVGIKKRKISSYIIEKIEC
jgi:hypothetical protein